VRIGDVFRWGDVVVQATSARIPCGTLARHLDAPDIVDQIGRPHRAGWYLRVLQEGTVKAEDPIAFEERGPEGWTIERAAAVFSAKDDVVGAQGLLHVAGLSSSWRERLEKRLSERR
jgi:MOSC domain-containing protein YiiM